MHSKPTRRAPVVVEAKMWRSAQSVRSRDFERLDVVHTGRLTRPNDDRYGQGSRDDDAELSERETIRTNDQELWVSQDQDQQGSIHARRDIGGAALFLMSEIV